MTGKNFDPSTNSSVDQNDIQKYHNI